MAGVTHCSLVCWSMRGQPASKLMDTRRNHILQRYGVAPDARLRSGMEAVVYTYGADAVLKLYPGRPAALTS